MISSGKVEHGQPHEVDMEGNITQEASGGPKYECPESKLEPVCDPQADVQITLDNW